MTIPRRTLALLACLLVLLALTPVARAQKESVKPGINESYATAKLEAKIAQFERSNRDVIENRDEIIAACELKPGMAIADIGAGTGAFARPFAPKVSPGGRVYAVDITKKFLDHIEKTCREAKLDNVVCVLCSDTSTKLPRESIDLAFSCNTYHHFEYPYKTLASIHEALRPHGKLVVVDFKREKGVSPEWVFGHVRAGKQTVIDEITKAGFKLIDDNSELMKVQYLLRFEKE